MNETTNLIPTSLPMRHDNPRLDLKVSSSSIKLLSLHNLPRHLYTLHGLHLNRKGKEKISRDIARLATHETGPISITDIQQPSSSNQPPPTTDHDITVIDANMWDMMEKYENDSSLGFSHTVSEDFHMSAGVAVVFRTKFKLFRYCGQ